MNDFIQCTCYLVSEKLADMGIDIADQEPTEALMTFRTDQVEAVREIVDDEAVYSVEDECLVILKSGYSFIVDKSYSDMMIELSGNKEG